MPIINMIGGAFVFMKYALCSSHMFCDKACRCSCFCPLQKFNL